MEQTYSLKQIDAAYEVAVEKVEELTKDTATHHAHGSVAKLQAVQDIFYQYAEENNIDTFTKEDVFKVFDKSLKIADELELNFKEHKEVEIAITHLAKALSLHREYIAYNQSKPQENNIA